MDFTPGDYAQLLLLLFFWVPFAAAAYFIENWSSERAKLTTQKLVHPIRHMRHMRDARAMAT